MEDRAMVPPHDMDAERAVIGACMVSEAALGVVSEALVPRDFYSETHRIIYGAALSLAGRGEPVDHLTLAEELGRGGELGKTGGREYLFRIVDSVPTAANAREYARAIREKAVLRDLMDVGSTIARDAAGRGASAEEALDAAEQAVYEIGDRGRSREGQGSSSMAEIGPAVLEMVQALYESGAEVTGISSPFRDLDRLTTGLHDGDLVVLAARPAMGKTALALALGEHAAGAEGVGVAVFSLEMAAEQLGQRLVSKRSGIPVQEIRGGQIRADDWPSIVRATAEVAQLPVEVDDTPGITVAQMRSRLRRMAQKLKARGTPLGLVGVDYLQLMDGGSGRRDGRQQEISDISRGLKVMARDLGVPVLALSQLSRVVETRLDKRPMLSDLRDSGAIEQDADVVMFIYRDEYYDDESDDKGVAEIIVGKHRNGPTGKVKLAWRDKLATFGSLAKTAGPGAL